MYKILETLEKLEFYIRRKKFLNCFSGHFFEKQMRQGRFFYFYTGKK